MNWASGLAQVSMTNVSEPCWKLTPRQGMPASFMGGLHPGSGWSHQYSSAGIGGVLSETEVLLVCAGCHGTAVLLEHCSRL